MVSILWRLAPDIAYGSGLFSLERRCDGAICSTGMGPGSASNDSRTTTCAFGRPLLQLETVHFNSGRGNYTFTRRFPTRLTEL